MLQINPKPLGCLNELEADLLDRHTHAEAELWVGEIEGIDLTLTFLRAKQEDASVAFSTVNLGIPPRGLIH